MGIDERLGIDNHPAKGVISHMKNFTFYVAGPWADRPNVRDIAEKVKAANWQVNSRWLDPALGEIPTDPDAQAKYKFEHAIRDVEDVMSADGLIYVNSMKSEGKATELGISIAMMKPIIIVGQRGREGNIFLNLRIPYYPTIEEALEWLKMDGLAYIAWVEAKRGELYDSLMMGTDPDFGDTQQEFPSE